MYDDKRCARCFDALAVEGRYCVDCYEREIEMEAELEREKVDAFWRPMYEAERARRVNAEYERAQREKYPEIMDAIDHQGEDDGQ